MKHSFIYNPKFYTLSAEILGYLLIGNYTANQQNALGNWFMTIGQVLECNSAIQQSLEEIYQGNVYNINSNKYKSTGNPNTECDSLLELLKNNPELDNITEALNTLINLINQTKK